jgi:4-hydroxyphenylpyruvate dioxygenase
VPAGALSVRRGIATVCLSGTLEQKLAAAAQAGFDGVEIFEPDLIGSRLTPPEIRIRAAEQLHALAVRAAERGIRVAYEALAWGRWVNEYDHAWRIVRGADHPALGVCLDSFHILSRGSSLDAIADIPAEKLFFLQLADAPHLVMDVLQWSRHYRCFPGQGGFDLADFTARVLAAGYRGPLSLEVFNDVFRQADPTRMAVDALRSLLTLEESITAPDHRALPAPPRLHGYAFAELAVEPTSVGDTQGLLHAMGFTPTAQHRTKPVTLWRQGDVRILLNAGAPVAPGIAAVARGRELRPGSLGPALRDAARPGARTPALERIDHIALAQPFDYFDEAALFYRSVLGLEPLESLELAAPTGLVRSRAVTNGDGSVRLALNVPVLAHDSRPGAGPQHVAFACSDIFAVAERMRERGLVPLAIPDNYYDDVAARTELDPGLIAAMREHRVLYERDETGEFLHFYTSTVGTRLCFEVVERRGGYAGYGAGNAPVRMAAQRAEATAPRDLRQDSGARLGSSPMRDPVP